jgi:signal transduction histidine kinase
MLAISVPLALRRRFPFSVAGVVVVAYLVAQIVHVPEANVSLLAAWLIIYSVAVHGQRRFRTLVLILCYSAIVAELVRELFFVSPTNGPALAASFSLFYNMVELALPWLLGAAIWSLRDRQRRLADQTVELQNEREENARQAVFAERVRIARELHDVVAHHVSVIGVQAAGARRVMDRQPARAAEALSSIEDSSRRAVVELHRLLPPAGPGPTRRPDRRGRPRRARRRPENQRRTSASLSDPRSVGLSGDPRSGDEYS